MPSRAFIVFNHAREGARASPAGVLMPSRAFIVFNTVAEWALSADWLRLNALTGIHCF